MSLNQNLNFVKATEKKENQVNNINNRPNFNSTQNSLAQNTPNPKQYVEKSPLQQQNINPEIHNTLLNPIPFNVQNPYLFKEFKKGLIPTSSKQNAYFANIAKMNF